MKHLKNSTHRNSLISVLLAASSGVAAAFGFAAGPAALGATLEEDVVALAGTWDGPDADAAHAGQTFRLEVAASAAGTGLLADLKATASDAALLAPVSLSLLSMDSRAYGLTSTDGTPEGAFAVEHAPFGGVKMARLARGPAADQIQSQEIVVGRAQADGSRRLRVTIGERQCRDATSHAFIRCGGAATRTYVMKRTVPQ